ncbi:MAG: hypothetical protein ABIS92_10680, partial [Polyangia bacterium]
MALANPRSCSRAALLVASVLAAAAAAMIFGEEAASARSRDEFDIVRYVPADSVAAVRGRQVAMRFDLGRRFELTLQVNNAFAAQNRRAIARAEAEIAAIPGVRRVIGPSGLLTVAVDASGRATSAPLLAGGPGEAASERVRQRLIRRSDAIGWFFSRAGTEIRLLVDTDDLPAVQSAIETTAASSGLVLLSGVAPAAPLWPEPDRRPRPFPPWLPFLLVVGAMMPGACAAAASSRPTVPRGSLIAIAAGLAAAAPLMLAPVEGIRQYALWSACVVAAVMALLITVFRMAATAPGVEPVRLRTPLAILLPSVVLVGAAAVLAPRLALGTQLWTQTSVFFVEVRGDMEEPVVLRELRRLTDFLRAEPGVAHAWSIADLFFGIPAGGEDFGGIPAAPEAARAILVAARDDAAVRLELAADHRAALVGVRLDDESGVDRLLVLAHLDEYLQREHRPALRRISVADERLPPSIRGLGRGILAADMLERVLRICERSGRMLSDSDVRTIERASRRAALLPLVDPVKFKAAIAQEVTAFLEQVAIAAAQVTLPRPAERQRLVDRLAGQPADARVGEVSLALRELWGRRLPDAVVTAQAVELHRRLAGVRRRDSARINFNYLLYGADLPTEGVLSEEVRDATLDAMGPIVGVPTASDARGAFLVEAAAVGGAPSDQALSVAWMPLVLVGLIIFALFTALLLEAIGGLAALAWWP